jgi:hypothetical protein
VSTYELDDDLVQMFLTNRQGNAVPGELAAALKKQIPIPAPAAVGAIVKTVGAIAGQEDEGCRFIRWTADNFTHSPWIEVGNHEVPWRTDQIGRITAVLSEGVDL